jgi:hypothetical protein
LNRLTAYFFILSNDRSKMQAASEAEKGLKEGADFGEVRGKAQGERELDARLLPV